MILTKEDAYKKMNEMLILDKEELFQEGTRLYILGVLVGIPVGMSIIMLTQAFLGKV
jgi:hypothetical protein